MKRRKGSRKAVKKKNPAKPARKKKAAKAKPKAKKPAKRSPKKAAKRVAKKAAKKKAPAKKAPAKKVKKVAKKAARPKKKAPAKKPAVKKAPAPRPAVRAPAPKPQPIPPITAVAPNEQEVGVVTHYYSHLGVAVLRLTQGSLRTGDIIHIKGHTTDFRQVIESMEIEHQKVPVVTPGQSFGLKVMDHAREHDKVYKVMA